MHVIVGLEVGGAELMLSRLVDECSKNFDCQQTVISLKAAGNLGDEIEKTMSGVDVISLNMNSMLSFPLVFYKLVRVFKLLRPQVVYTWMYHSDLVGGIAAYICGIRNICWGIRCTEIPQSSVSVTALIIKICAFLSYYIPRNIICCADSAKQTHIALGYCEEKMAVIPNGYDLKLFNPSDALKLKVKSDIGLNEDVRIVGFVGRFDELKDAPNFIRAAAIVSQSISRICFIMIGRGIDGHNEKLVSLISNLALEDKVILFGERQPHDFYAAMDCFCLSSKSEGFPNVVAEAMAMRTPCVVTNVGDAAIIVSGHGRVVPPQNSEALAKALIDILMVSKEKLDALGNDARTSIESRYDIKVIAKKYMYLAGFDLNK